MHLSVVLPVHNEEEIILETLSQVDSECQKIGQEYEILVIDDGSTDSTLQQVENFSQHHTQVKYLSFSKNFGHEAAMLAGLQHSRGEAVIVMDADLQHPPSLISQMYQKYRDGYQVVMMARDKNHATGAIRSLVDTVFYKFLNFLSDRDFYEHASDFFLVSRRVAVIINTSFQEKLLFLRGFVQSVGFKQCSIAYSPQKRTKGSSKYSLTKLLLLSFDSIILFSDKPLHLAIITGMLFSFFSVILAVYSLVMKVLLNQVLAGYTTLVVFVSFSIGVQLIFLGILAQYIRSILHEVRHRPLYIIDKAKGLDIDVSA